MKVGVQMLIKIGSEVICDFEELSGEKGIVSSIEHQNEVGTKVFEVELYDCKYFSIVCLESDLILIEE